jgi:hypothetical protein
LHRGNPRGRAWVMTEQHHECPDDIDFDHSLIGFDFETVPADDDEDAESCPYSDDTPQDAATRDAIRARPGTRFDLESVSRGFLRILGASALPMARRFGIDPHAGGSFDLGGEL